MINESNLDVISEFYSPESRGDLPSFFSNYRVSSNGYMVGFLYYSPGFVRIAILSSECELKWMSGNASGTPPPSAWFIPQQQGISPDGSRIWYFDGTILYSCIVGGV